MSPARLIREGSTPTDNVTAGSPVEGEQRTTVPSRIIGPTGKTPIQVTVVAISDSATYTIIATCSALTPAPFAVALGSGLTVTSYTTSSSSWFFTTTSYSIHAKS